MKEHVSILPIVGIGGLGKTALAQCVYNDETISKHFNFQMWVCVSHDFYVKKIVKNMIECRKKKKLDGVVMERSQSELRTKNEDVMERLQSELRGKIDGKRYLLVLDYLWSVE